MAARVAPARVSVGVARLTTGRFQRRMTRITPTNETALIRNAIPTPANATTAPASAGPMARAKLNSMPLSADAAGRSSFSTSSGSTARHVGDSKASPEDNANVRIRRSSGDMSPASVNPATSDATAIIHVSVPRMILRRSRMSPTAPAGRASTKKGSADAVWMSATYIGPALSDTISQAAPTLCMKVPISETTFAVSRLRNVGERNGRQRLFDGRLDEFGNGPLLTFLSYQERCRNPVFVSFYL